VLLLIAVSHMELTTAEPAAAPLSRPTPGNPSARTALEFIPANVKVIVMSPAFRARELIPFEYTQYRSNAFPGLA